MRSRVTWLPGAGGQGVMEPLSMRWVGVGWRTLPSGIVIETHARKAVEVDPYGEWELAIKPHGKGIWRYLRGGPETRLIDFFADMAGVQFGERDGDAETGS